jgi:Protein of unknown function (DUF3485)
VARLIPLLTVVFPVVFSGFIQGSWTNRWGASGAVATAVSRLPDVPMSVGDWDAQSRELTQREITVADLGGYLFRRYVHRKTGAVVTVLLVCGRPGPISVHTPDVCYQGAGYEEISAPDLYSCPTEPGGQFMVRQFRKRNVATPGQLRILYAWSAGSTWAAPKYPRISFARESVLFKMYVIGESPKSNEPVAESPEGDLLRLLLPQLGPVLA